MKPLIGNFSELLDDSTKYSHVKLVDRVDTEAFIAISYLRAASRLNILDRKVIWNHEVLMILYVLQFHCIGSRLFVV